MLGGGDSATTGTRSTLASPPVTPPSTGPGGPLRILLVEDDATDAQLIGSRLTTGRGSGWTVEHSATLRDARKALLEHDTAPDCILLDLSLPDAHGLEGIVVLGAAVPDIAIVVMSSDGEREPIALAALAEGAQDHLSKISLAGSAPHWHEAVLRAHHRKASSNRVHRNTRLARAILDAIDAPTVAIDGRGRIMLTNAAWRSVAAIGRASPTAVGVGVGVNYLDVCDAARGRDAAGAVEAAAGIRGVLSGDTDRFSIDYPSETPRGMRWFSMRVTQLGALGGGAVASHLEITDIKHAEQALRAATPDGLPVDPDHAPQIFLVIDTEAGVKECSDLTRDLLGVDASAVVGTDFGAWVHPTDRQKLTDALQEVAARPGGTLDTELRIRDTSLAWHVVDVVLLNRIGDDRVDGIVLTGRDVTERHRAHLRARLEPRLLEQLPSALIVTDDAGVVVYWNPRAAMLFGSDEHAVIGHDMVESARDHDDRLRSLAIRDAIGTGGRWEGSFDINRPDGSVVPGYGTFEPIELADIGFSGIVGTVVDIAERRRLEEDLVHAAHYDDLTGLPNRRHLEQHLGDALSRPEAPAGIAVLLLGVDGLDRVNDTYGYGTGDLILREVAETVQRVVPRDAMVARFIGDSFVVVLPAPEAVGVAAAVHEGLRVAGALGDTGITPTVGIGIRAAQPGDTIDGIIGGAHVARERAKHTGRAGTVLYNPDLEREERRRAALEAQLAGAVARGEMVVWYQPQVDIGSGRVVGAEALVRWEHPELGRLDPAAFLERAEHTGAISAIGAFVLLEAAHRAAEWRREFDPGFQVSVNLSARQLREPALVRSVAEVLAATGLDPAGLTLEITETTIIDDRAEATSTLAALRAIGVTISIDDFGTGYSSLSYLKELPADSVKIDRSFVSHVDTDPRDRAIVAAILSLADALGLEVVAEGVETAEQRDTLARLGCELAQGYLWFEPEPAESVATVLRGAR